jgi:hypothetical protein
MRPFLFRRVLFADSAANFLWSLVHVTAFISLLRTSAAVTRLGKKRTVLWPILRHGTTPV